MSGVLDTIADFWVTYLKTAHQVPIALSSEDVAEMTILQTSAMRLWGQQLCVNVKITGEDQSMGHSLNRAQEVENTAIHEETSLLDVFKNVEPFRPGQAGD